MWKWILISVAALALAIFAFLQLPSTKVAYVNGLEEYRDIPGREFLLQRPCYIFSYHERSKHTDAAYPLIGLNASDLTTSTPELPAEVSPEQMAKAHAKVRLMEIMPTGSIFKIISVRREQNPKTGTRFSYEIKFIDDKERAYQRVDARQIILPMSADEIIPKIDPAVAVPRVKY